MTAPKHEDQWLDALLKEPSPYVDDNGFTARVVERLPKRSSRRRVAILATFAALALGAAWLLPVPSLLTESLTHTFHWSGSDVTWTLVGWVVLGLIAWGSWGLAQNEQ